MKVNLYSPYRMSDLANWEAKIKEKRKHTDFRSFIKEIASWGTFSIYKRDGKLCRYPVEQRVPVLDDQEFLNADKYFLDSVSDENFMNAFTQFFRSFPLQRLIKSGNEENSDFTDQVFAAKNCYLSFIIGYGVENIMYTAFSYSNCHNVLNSFFCTNNVSNIYSSAGITNSHNIFYSKYLSNCNNIRFSTNLIGCEECLFCNGLENQKYCIENKQYNKEEYQQKKSEILHDKISFQKYYENISQVKAINYLTTNSSGNFILKSDNVENGHWLINFHNSRNTLLGNGANGCSEFFDVIDAGIDSSSFYGIISAGSGSNDLYCSYYIEGSQHIFYSVALTSCAFCFGCIGLRNKSYCIFNKQYSKEEWYELADKIFSQMETNGSLGKFFPGEMNPFYFNDTLAYLIDDSFTKEEVTKEGYLRRDEEIKVDIPLGMEVLATQQLSSYQGYDSNGRWTINPDILKKAIKDEKGNIYRIVKMEYDFLVKHELPLPELHWMDRIKLGFKF